MLAQTPIHVWLDNNVCPALHEIMSSNNHYFQMAPNVEKAEIIIFERDDRHYIQQTELFKKWPEKCIVVSECDKPTYFLPACYTSNKRSLLNRGRTKTIPYIFSLRAIPNPYIRFTSNNPPLRYLYSFVGGSTSWVRKKLFKFLDRNKKDVLIKESNQYFHWNYEQAYLEEKLSSQEQYAKLMEQSAFVLCPRDAGLSSIRLFEVMQAGRVPVIISDEWQPIDNMQWNEFSLQISENELPRIDEIIPSHGDSAKALGDKARLLWQQYCSPGNDIVLLAKSIRTIQEVRIEKKEKFIRFIFPLLEGKNQMKGRIRLFFKFFIFRLFILLGKKFPYSLNRPIEYQYEHREKSKCPQ